MTKRMLIAVLAMIGLFVALYLTLYKMGIIGSLTCSIGSCETVNSSRWSRLLGVPVAGWGVFFYLDVLIIALIGIQPLFAQSKAVSWLLALWAGFGVLFSSWLTYLELFRIHAICIWCVTSASIVLAIFVLSLLDVQDISRRAQIDDNGTLPD
jgi:uncharacterized membrane protein